MTEVAEWRVTPWTLCQDLILWGGGAWRSRQEEKGGRLCFHDPGKPARP